MKIQRNGDTFSIVEVTNDDLRVLNNAIICSSLPDKRILYNLKTQIEEQTK